MNKCTKFENEDELRARLEEIEKLMAMPDFWDDKVKAQELIKEMNEIKEELKGAEKYDNRNAIVTIIAGAGGLDSEDFARMLTKMYFEYAKNQGWNTVLLSQNQNEHGGFSSISFEIKGRGAYGRLKNESGVHRLVRVSPFNANKKRHTSFCLVDVVPEMDTVPKNIDIPDSDLEISFARSSGPGGQNVNKRSTSVRIKHIPTGISVHVESERSQEANRNKAMKILYGKIYRLREEELKGEASKFNMTDGININWGNQIRSYVLHPYKMVKDHRSGFETSDVEKVLEEGELDGIINSCVL